MSSTPSPGCPHHNVTPKDECKHWKALIGSNAKDLREAVIQSWCILSTICIHTVNRKAYNQFLLLCFLLFICSTATLCHPQKRPGFHCAKKCTNREQKKVASIHKYFSSNCLVKCHHPYTAICWAIHLASLQPARQHDHQLCNAQELALLKRVFSQLLSCKRCSLPTLCGSRLSSFLYMNVFIWKHSYENVCKN